MENNFPKIPLLLSIIFFILFSFMFLFLYRTINDNNQKAELNMVKWTIEARRRDSIRLLDRSLGQITSDQAQLETHFAKSSDVVPFLDTIEKLALKAGASAQIDSVNTGADDTGLVVGLKVSGNFEAIYRFLRLLENSPYELSFLSVDIYKLGVPAVLGKSSISSKWEAIFSIQLLSFIP